jgi:hypothetical protein
MMTELYFTARGVIASQPVNAGQLNFTILFGPEIHHFAPTNALLHIRLKILKL